MFFVISHLNCTPTFRLINRYAHRVRDMIRIHNDMTVRISRRTSYRLYQGSLRTQEAFFVSIQNSDKRNLRNIQSLYQKIDTHKYIKHVQTHITNDLRPFQCINIGMQIFHPYSQFSHIVSKVFCHTFGQCSHKYFILFGNLCIDF